jgi:hypothetical protein
MRTRYRKTKAIREFLQMFTNPTIIAFLVSVLVVTILSALYF